MVIVRANKVSLVLGLITATLCVAFGVIYIFGDVRKGDLVYKIKVRCPYGV